MSNDAFYCEHCEQFIKDDKDELYYHIIICDNFSKITKEEYIEGIKGQE